MTIFDKLSGFAQKAKENAVARAILAKDKRLEKSMSEGIQTSHIGLLKMSTYGVPGTVTAIAFDPVASLLAVAGGSDSNTFIRVFGKGISSELVLNNPARVKYLQFKIGYPTLAVVDRNNVISTYDLQTKRVRHVLNAPSIITSLEYCAGTEWLFIGFADGNIDVFNLDTGRFSEEYGIPDLFLDETSKPKEDARSSGGLVVAIQMHPHDLNSVLIGYESAAFIWNIREQTVKKSFTVQRNHKQQPSQLTCLAWSPCGSRFMAGYDDGYMRLWDVKSEQKPILSRRAFQAMPTSSPSSDPCEPIYRMVWYLDEASKKSFLIVAGGADLPDIRGLHIMEFDTENDLRDARRQTILSTSVDVSDFILLSRDLYFLGVRNPLGLLIIGCDGALRAHGLGHGYPTLTLPSALQFLDPPIKQAYLHSHLNETTFQHLMSTDQNQVARTYYLPLTGGVAGSKHVYRLDSNDLLITVHSNNLVRFWDASFTALRPLAYLTIDCSNLIKERKGNIKCVAFDRLSRSVSIGLDNNTILYYSHQLPVVKAPASDTSYPVRQPGHESIIENCDNTLNEISDLLKDMESNSPEAEITADAIKTGSPKSITVDLANTGTNPFEAARDGNKSTDALSESRTESPRAGNLPQETEHNVHDPKNHSTNSAGDPGISEVPNHVSDSSMENLHNGLNIQMLDTDPNAVGYQLKMKINLDIQSVKQLIAEGDSLLTISTTDSVFVIDTTSGKVIYTTEIQVEADSTKIQIRDGETHPDEKNHTKTDQEIPSAAITSVCLYQSYAPTDYSHTTIQLYVGLDNGIVYQHDLNSKSSAPVSIIPPITCNPIVNIHVVNLHGQLQTALPKEANILHSSPVPNDEPESNDKHSPHQKLQESNDPSGNSTKEEESTGNRNEKSSLLRKATRKLSRSGGRLPKEIGPPPPLPTGIMASERGESSPSSPVTVSKKTQHSKWEYHPQADPHYIFVVSTKSVACVLAGYNVRLFSMELHDNESCTDKDIIIHSQIMGIKDGKSLTSIRAGVDTDVIIS
ncbi:hypothetical protein BX666DRAFT_1913266 [Dichotomocladium elegans]|nr:hypothetical protein BX666DRAFT_1913266 [Dichotomocladium elegans]